ncbi:hypothetical protein THASP1DRAFT_31393 [Thamnocephalis sphaerospora]|uniref:Sec1-like protein n=1 Tax=Thamnocephalis sphaerospora TaxID=78915 RepID=A0A4P9XLV2_9FUNG|nr:hypothetical protein THASP1DRAFT_31393 [Thamnocephalis sphaerospora]|eukprot:RKP06802.1 hypothetical protein THASP1DRAFT_31393 [Thamnocephalis sphaerospora]
MQADDPLRARAFQFWRNRLLPALTADATRPDAEAADTAKGDHDGAVVYASAAALEAVKWSCPGGVAALFDAGATSVKCLDDVPVGDYGGEADKQQSSEQAGELRRQDPATAYILIASHVAQYELQLRALLQAGQIRRVCLWLGLPDGIQHPPSAKEVHSAAADEPNSPVIVPDGGTLARWTVQMQTWYESSSTATVEPLVVEMHAAPALLWACVGRRFYVAPTCTQVFPALDVVADDPLAPVSNSFTEEQRIGMRDLGALLAVTLEELRYRGEFFVVGETAKYVAHQCHRQASHAATAAIAEGQDGELANAAVVIIDRTLDLVAPCWHQDNLLDQIYRVLHRRDVHDGSLDLSISASCLAASVEPQGIVPGKLCSIAHGLNEEAFDLFDAMAMSGQKDGLNLVRKTISDVITFENINAKIPRSMGRVTPALLNKLLSAFQDEREQKIRHAPLVETTAAVIQTLQESNKAMWDELAALEKTTSLCVGDAQQLAECLQGAVPKVNETGAVASRMRKSYTLKDAMLLALSAYSLGGEDLLLPEDLETLLVDRWFAAALAGSRAVLDGESNESEDIFRALNLCLNTPESTDEISEENKTAVVRERRARVEAWLERVRARLHEIARARTGLSTLGKLLREASLLPYTPFIQQLFEDIYSVSAGDELSQDLEHIPAGGTLGSYLSGFSRFLSSSKPRPGQYRRLVLCVVGGITFNEVRTVRELTMNESVIILSTDIATGNTMFRHVFSAPA